jgi:putative tryptophan/tyrosine transport system substrate-binding protein
MRRRDLIVGASASALWPYTTFAQVSKVWRVAILDTATRELNNRNLEVLFKRLRELGYAQGTNLIVDYRSADGRNERLPALVTDLLSFNPDVILVRGTPEILAVKNATSTIPVVMTAVADPVGVGVAASLSRPGGNITGMASTPTEIETKRVEYLKEMVPHLKRLASLGDFRNPAIHLQWEEVQAAARSLGIEPLRFDVRSAADLVQAFEAAIKQEVQAVRVGIDGTTWPNRRLIIDLAARYKVPTVYAAREFAEDGGLMSYAPDYPHLYLRAASFVDRIFKGEKPVDLPIELPSKYELVVNVATAKALGISVPPAVLIRADEVIE